MSASSIELEMYCPACGYDLRASESGICPECGGAFELQQLAQTNIPWEHRSRFGAIGGFLRTLWNSTMRIGRFKSEVAREVSYLNAQRFRWAVVLLAWIVASAGLAVYRFELAREVEKLRAPIVSSAVSFISPAKGWLIDLMQEIFICAGVGMLAWPIPIALVLLLLIGWSGACSYLFHPRRLPLERQDRAIAISYYACGPLVLFALALPLIGAGTWVLQQNWIESGPGKRFAGTLVIAIGAAVACFAILKTILNTILLLRWSTNPAAPAMILRVALIVLLWAAVAVFAGVLFPAVVGFVSILIDSTQG